MKPFLCSKVDQILPNIAVRSAIEMMSRVNGPASVASPIAVVAAVAAVAMDVVVDASSANINGIIICQ